MKVTDGALSLSPTDLSHFLSCRHRTALELSVAHDVRKRPVWDDPLLKVLFEMGEQHEREYVEALKQTSKGLVDLKEEKDRDTAIARTRDAMRVGADVIVQAALANGRWYGRPDVLMKVDRPSPALGAWSYEVADTKLARETRGGTILQLGLYCELVEAAQGVAPEHFYVVTPEARHSYRFHDYAAYFRLIKSKFEAEVEGGPDRHVVLEAASYPEPVDHCDICPWIVGCEKRRRADDHLSLVAGISRLQRRELEPRGVLTVESLAGMGEPVPFKPDRGAVETYERIRDQARVQVRSRAEGRIVYELIAGGPGLKTRPPSDVAGGLQPAGQASDSVGLARLPLPSPGDVFLDLEGDPLAAEGGREYLFGLVTVEPDGSVRYQCWWALDPAAERAAFEAVVDLITARLVAFPDIHVYHYAPYEPSAFKRLMGRYATREREIDELLRGRRFIDLYAVVRQGVRAGVERYSIKNLEPLYAFTRDVDLRDANRALRVMEQALEFDRPDLATSELRNIVQGYNRDDCVSTLRLRDWLEARRVELVETGAAIERPPLIPGEATKDLDDKAKAVEALRARLLPLKDGYQLAYLLDWHRREDKAGWWEYFRLCELPEEDLLEEPRAVAGLEYVRDLEKVKKSVVQRYSYPEQEIEIRLGDDLKTQDGKVFPTGHPDGVSVSALQNILGEAQTMPPEAGLFLPITWRLPPSICAFTSELFYSGKLESKPGLERRALAGNGMFDGAGLWLVTVEHQGNRNASAEEADVVASIVERLLAPGSMWVDEDGAEHQMTSADIRVVAPFNAHVERMRHVVGPLGLGAADRVPIGTVDKFQGQEAPVVIYSMATSRPEDAPRGMEFLYSLNRINVATSRAQCACIVVLSPRLFEPECRTPRQMHLANALARYREMAKSTGSS